MVAGREGGVAVSMLEKLFSGGVGREVRRRFRGGP